MEFDFAGVNRQEGCRRGGQLSKIDMLKSIVRAISMKLSIPLAFAFVVAAGSAHAQSACTYNAVGIPNAPVGSFSRTAGGVTVDGQAAAAGGILSNGSTVVTQANGSVNLLVGGQSIPVAADQIVCITQTGPDICVQVGSSLANADCSTLNAAVQTPAPTPPVTNVLLPVAIIGGAAAAVLIGSDGDDSKPTPSVSAN